MISKKKQKKQLKILKYKVNWIKNKFQTLRNFNQMFNNKIKNIMQFFKLPKFHKTRKLNKIVL